MAKIQLTAAVCQSAVCPPGSKKIDLWDIICSGFVLEVRPSGGKTYALRYFDGNGRQRQHKIGRFGEISFDQARKTAHKLRSEVVLGGSPLSETDISPGQCLDWVRNRTLSCTDITKARAGFAAQVQSACEPAPFL